MIKTTFDIPTKEGTQFVITWEHGGKIWADTCEIEDGKLLVYNDNNDEFETDYSRPWVDDKQGVIYLISKKQT